MRLPTALKRFTPMFPIGAMDHNQMEPFAQWGMARRPFMPQVFFIDKAGNVQAQFMGGDSFFEGDTVSNVRATLQHVMSGGATTSTAKKAPATAKK